MINDPIPLRAWLKNLDIRPSKFENYKKVSYTLIGSNSYRHTLTGLFSDNDIVNNKLIVDVGPGDLAGKLISVKPVSLEGINRSDNSLIVNTNDLIFDEFIQSPQLYDELQNFSQLHKHSYQEFHY